MKAHKTGAPLTADLRWRHAVHCLGAADRVFGRTWLAHHSCRWVARKPASEVPCRGLGSACTGTEPSGPAGLLVQARANVCLPLPLHHLCQMLWHIFASQQLCEGAELARFLSVWERMWLREVSYHKDKLETSLCLEPSPSHSTFSALSTFWWLNMIPKANDF